MFRQEAAAVELEPPVLVADPGQRSLIGAMLARAGFRAEAVATGEEALEAARQRRPQLAVLEVRLGDISGYEVCRALREEYGDTPGSFSCRRTGPTPATASRAC